MILIDSSIWIDFFKYGRKSNYLDVLIKNNLLVINDLILAEILPILRLKKQHLIIELLDSVRSIPLDIHWPGIIDIQLLNIKNGINKVGIPDIILLQHCLDNNLELWSFDKHFELMAKITKLKLFVTPSFN